MTASIDNAVIPLKRNNSINHSPRKRDKNDKPADFITNQLSGCDILVLKSGIWISVKEAEIVQNKIRYKLCDSLNGPIDSISISEVLMIKYYNGKRHYFTPSDAVVYSGSDTAQVNEGIGLAGFTLNMINVGIALILSIGALFATGLGPVYLLLFFSATLCPVLGLIGFIFGCVSQGRINRHPDKFNGRGFAAVSIILGLIGIIAGIIIWTKWG